jgi:hypothetical protein
MDVREIGDTPLTVVVLEGDAVSVCEYGACSVVTDRHSRDRNVPRYFQLAEYRSAVRGLGTEVPGQKAAGEFSVVHSNGSTKILENTPDGSGVSAVG